MMTDEDDVPGLAAAAAAISPLSSPHGPWATHYAQVALKTAFGPIVQVVGDSLMSRGAQSIDELAKHTKLDYATLKKALLTLIQQDLVQPRYDTTPPRQSAAAAKKPRPPRVLYALQLDSLRFRSRFAHYLLWIKQCFGPECEYIMQTLLVHGKLSSTQVMQLTFSSIAEKGRLAAQEVHRIQLQNAIAEAARTNTAVAKPLAAPPAPNAFDRARIHDVFRQLVASQYIKRAQGLISPEELAARAAAAAAAEAAGESATGSSSVNRTILETFLANQAVSVAKVDAEREATAAAAAAAGAQDALRASTAASVAAAAAAAPAGKTARKRKKVIADDDEEGEGAGGDGGADAASPAKPAAKRAKKKTKKELEAEAKEARLEQLRATRAKEEAEQQASLDRAGKAASNSDAAAADGSAAAAAGGDATVHDDDHILWTVNHAQFVWEFRKKAVVDYVTEQHSASCGFLVAQMMREYALADNGMHPPVYDTPAIIALCEQAAEKQMVLNPVPNEEVADDCIHQLLGDDTNFFERKSHPRGYVINMQSLFDELRLRHIQSLCRARHGPLSARIFRCLLQSQRLEETQLSELCTAPRKSVRSLLYLMQRAQIVAVQEVPRTSDRMPQKTFYVWSVPRADVCARYLDELYFGWCNLRLRGAAEAERAKPLLDKVDTHNTISETERKKVEQWKKAADRIEVALHKLNQIIMLFADF